LETQQVFSRSRSEFRGIRLGRLRGAHSTGPCGETQERRHEVQISFGACFPGKTLNLPQALGAQIAHQAGIGEPVGRGCWIGEKPGVAADLWQARRIGGNDGATQGHGLKDRQRGLSQPPKNSCRSAANANIQSQGVDFLRDGKQHFNILVDGPAAKHFLAPPETEFMEHVRENARDRDDARSISRKRRKRSPVIQAETAAIAFRHEKSVQIVDADDLPSTGPMLPRLSSTPWFTKGKTNCVQSGPPPSLVSLIKIARSAKSGFGTMSLAFTPSRNGLDFRS
jgi:hypothetical protein